MREKVKNDYGGDVRCIVDAARGSLVFSTLGGLLEVVEALVSGSSSADAAAAAGATQFIIVRVKDRLSKPATGGYRDIMLNGSVAGHVCELQLQVKKLLDFKAHAHKLYEILRSVGWDGDERRPIALRPKPVASPVDSPLVNDATAARSSGAAASELPPATADTLEPFSGLLLKRANLVKDWRQRFFTIHIYHEESRRAAELRYFEKAHDAESTPAKPDAEPKGIISLQGAAIADGKGDVEFSVSSSGGEKYLLRAHTREAKDAWKRKLLEAKSWSQQHVS